MTEVSSVGCQTETRTGTGIILEDISESEIGIDTSSRSGSEDELEPEHKHEPVQDAEIQTEQDPPSDPEVEVETGAEPELDYNSDLDEEGAEDLEQTRHPRNQSEDASGSMDGRSIRRDDLWLSLHHFQAGEEVRLLCLFSHLCSLTAVRQRRAGLEMCFSSRENLQRGRLLAKRLVASRMQLRWHVGRLNSIPKAAGGATDAAGNDSSGAGGGASEPGRLGVLSRLRRAFLNYFQHT